jgi:hypothetical protein
MGLSSPPVASESSARTPRAASLVVGATFVRVGRSSSLRRLAQNAAVITARNVSTATGSRGAIEI